MRPRLVSLGCNGTTFHPGAHDTGFNEAEARKPRMLHSGIPPPLGMQCFNEAEARKPRMLVCQYQLPVSRLGASMRPRLVSLGCAAYESRVRCGPEVASMRPRLVSLGCEAVPCGRLGRCHSFNEAEARKPRMRPSVAHALMSSIASFNEAEARKPRMLEQIGPVYRATSPASMRPRLVSLGCDRRKCTLYSWTQCFNEAEARKPRMPHSLPGE